MGTSSHEMTSAGPGDERVTLQALADAGVSFSMAPASVPERLGLRPHRTMHFHLAGGERAEWRRGRVTARVNGASEQVLIAWGSEGAPPVSRARTLQSIGQGVNPVEQRLLPREGLVAARASAR